MKPIERVMPSKERAHYAMAHLPMEDFEALRIDQQRYRKLRALLISPDRRWDLLTFVEHSKSQSIEEFDAVVDILPEAEAK